MSLKGETACWGLLISMKDGERLSLEQIRAFLTGSEEERFKQRLPPDRIVSLSNPATHTW
jgi:hypothetical protein